ncbi:MAG: B12-binding domain-containing radical SAM protein, partial [Polyangiaceae bacterium]|nr:B12-binding domain-containing radical SAM protein [Polyangiaceae bacterium]
MRLHLVAPSSEDSAPPDLVGISVSSKSAFRAYRLADAYRRRGSLVVLGGVHATAMPEEASAHADSVVLGEAEWIWRDVVCDARERRLRATYRHTTWPSLAGAPLPRRDIFASRSYVPFDVVQTTRGCPYPCEFCSVSTYNGPTFRIRPVPEVLGELERVGPRVLFADDNVMLHPRHGSELLQAMPGLRKQWVGQCSMATLHRAGIARQLARSGCKALFVGFESVDWATTQGAGKRQNQPRCYEQIVRELADHGIGVWGSFVFGFDHDEPESFERTLNFCVSAKLTMALFAILTPYPGTRLYQRLQAEGRLTMPRWWLGAEHDRDAPFFEPARMTRAQLRAGWVGAWLQMYSVRSMAKRFDPG